MPRTDAPDFQAWLETQPDVAPTGDETVRCCDSCGVGTDAHEFIGRYCVVCLAYRFGSFEKSQEIAAWIVDLRRTLVEGGINELAGWISSLGIEHRVPLATEEDGTKPG